MKSAVSIKDRLKNQASVSGKTFQGALTDSLTGTFEGDMDLDRAREERLKEKYERATANKKET